MEDTSEEETDGDEDIIDEYEYRGPPVRVYVGSSVTNSLLDDE